MDILRGQRAPAAPSGYRPGGRVTQYDCCTCGALKDIIDPMGRKTTFSRDTEGRVTAKTYPDGSAIHYVYENATSRLKSKTDVNGQAASYTYALDDDLARIDYTVPAGVAATPPVSFAYDAIHNRLGSVTVARSTQETEVRTYNPITAPPQLGAGRLAQVQYKIGATPLYTIGYTYDHLGRRAARTIDGNTASYAYDGIGRVQTLTNSLGAFSYGYGYGDATSRITLITGSQSPLNIAMGYYGNVSPAGTGNGDERLKTIANSLASGGAAFSSHSYGYDPFGHITSWSQANAGHTIPWQWSFEYDNADQLTGGIESDTSTSPAIQNTAAYAYDLSGNRTLAQNWSLTPNSSSAEIPRSAT